MSSHRHQQTSLCCVDPVLLRRALRLVHCLQKERGASCAYFVSRHGHDIVRNMERARVDSDRAVEMMREDLKVHSTLMKIRKMVDAAQQDTGGSSSSNGNQIRIGPAPTTAGPPQQSALSSSLEAAAAAAASGHPGNHLSTCSKQRSVGNSTATEKNKSSSCHRILVCFNALISSLVHDFFMEKIAKQERSLHRRHRRGSKNSDAGNDASSNIKRASHRRVRSHADALPTNIYSSVLTMNNPHAQQHFPPMLSLASGEGRPPKVPTSGIPGSLPGLFSDLNMPEGGPPEELPIMEDHPRHRRSGSLDESPSKGVSFEVAKPEEPEIVLIRLLNLLACFVKLKESTGVERAVLSALVVLGKEDSLLLSDLVLEVENQRRILDELKHQPVGSLRNLVTELVEMSQPLRELQQSILTNFDLDGIIINESEHDVNKVWNLITVYIDKLHSLELLIIEEVEYCLPSLESDSSHDHHHHHDVIRQPTLIQSSFIKKIFGASTSEEELLSRLEKMPAEEIKEQLLQGFATNIKNLTNGSSHHLTDISLGEQVNEAIDDPLLLIPSLPASKEWEINLYELKFLKRIGEGAAGTTYLANWTGLKVAVKVASITEMGLDGWRTEVQSLQKLHHPNIIRLLGSVYHQNPLTFCLVLEYCNAGDLGSAMKYPTAPGFFFHVATSIAKGIAYLHSRGIMHRDIKPDNILCDGNVRNGHFTVKVTDFGVATDTSILGDRTAETGTYRWMSPEVIRHESYSNMADVYSYAVVLWQLLSREDPYMGLSQIEAAGKVALERARPPFPLGTPPAVIDLIETCWSENPNDRYSFEELCTTLPKTQSRISSINEKWIDAPLGHPVYYPRDGDQQPQQAKKDQPPQNHRKDHKSLNVPTQTFAPLKMTGSKKKEEKPKDEKKKSGFFKIKMFGS